MEENLIKQKEKKIERFSDPKGDNLRANYISANFFEKSGVTQYCHQVEKKEKMKKI